MGKKRIMHYHSKQKILLVGEGDFSFPLCLARAFGTAVNMVATTFDSRVSLENNYASALSNLTGLEDLGCTIIHEVDARTMNRHPFLTKRKFDRIIFNFPHAGFSNWSEHHHLQIWSRQILVSGFLLSAKDLVKYAGEIHITHKTAYPFSEWNIQTLAENEGLFFVEGVEFYQDHYPGYNNKRGAGSTCDQSFPIGESCTLKFAIN